MSEKTVTTPEMAASGAKRIHGEPDRKGMTDDNASRPDPQTTLAWAGYSDGKIDTTALDLAGGFGCSLAIFRTKKLAKELYKDVRRVEVKEMRRAKR